MRNLVYQRYAAGAWSVLPILTLCELAGLTVYAINIHGRFILEPSHSQKQQMIVGVSAKTC